MPQPHTITTTHIQRLILNALDLAEALNGEQAGTEVPFPPSVYTGPEGTGMARVEHALCKAVSDLRHAADELDAERLNCFGWEQR